MVLTINGQTLETDDPKLIQDAIRAARKAEADERKARKRREAERAQAEKLAEAEALRNAYYVHEDKALKRRCRQFVKPYAKYSPVHIEGEYPDTILVIDCEGGRARFRSFSWHYVGCIMGGNGFCLAIFLKDRESGAVECCAIGAHRLASDPNETAHVLRRCTGVMPEDFTHEDSQV